MENLLKKIELQKERVEIHKKKAFSLSEDLQKTVIEIEKIIDKVYKESDFGTLCFFKVKLEEAMREGTVSKDQVEYAFGKKISDINTKIYEYSEGLVWLNDKDYSNHPLMFIAPITKISDDEFPVGSRCIHEYPLAHCSQDLMFMSFSYLDQVVEKIKNYSNTGKVQP